MKIHRAPRSTGEFDETETRRIDDDLQDWSPFTILTFDGTKNKIGKRHTNIGVQFSPADIAALNDALLRYYRQRIGKLEEQRDKYRESNRKLEKALRISGKDSAGR